MAMLPRGPLISASRSYYNAADWMGLPLISQGDIGFCKQRLSKISRLHRAPISLRTKALKPEHEAKDTSLSACDCQWYPIAVTDILNKNVPNAVTVSGKDLVVWWDNNGHSWQVWHDNCPHRLVPLSEGKINEKGDLQCSKHGWCFAASSGSCTVLPRAVADGALEQEESASVVVYPSIEHNGFIWFSPNSGLENKDIVARKLPPSISTLASKDERCSRSFLDSENWIQNLACPVCVPSTTQGLQDACDFAIEGGGLVPYRDDWPTSFSALPGGGQIVSDLTMAWDGLADRLSSSTISGKQMQLILSALKLTFSALNKAPGEGRIMLANSLATAYTLADLQMDARVMAAGLLRSAVDAGLFDISLISQELGRDVGRLLHDCMRFNRTLNQMDLFDEESAKAVRQFCLSYHDILAIIIEFSSCLQQLRHSHDLPPYQQQILALEALQIHAPLAHAIGAKEVSTELEDLSFKLVLPNSYRFLNSWLHSHWPDENSVLEECKLRLSSALEQDEKLKFLTGGFTISGRLKSRFSIMKKLLKDGRRPEEVYDIMGLRVVLTSKTDDDGLDSIKTGRIACYRVLEIVKSLWKEVPGRLKDYVANPKSNGYESLHVSVYLSNSSLKQPTMELQIRTSSMDFKANDGDASHSLYKGGLTDPDQVQQLKKLMMAAADRAALSFKELNSDVLLTNAPSNGDLMFHLFDKNNDGEISMSEFHQVMGDLGADGEEANELMQLIDVNRDGSVSANEFAEFKRKVSLLQGYDRRYINRLGFTLRGYTAGKKGLAAEKHAVRNDTFNNSNTSSMVGSAYTSRVDGQTNCERSSEMIPQTFKSQLQNDRVLDASSDRCSPNISEWEKREHHES